MPKVIILQEIAAVSCQTSFCSQLLGGSVRNAGIKILILLQEIAAVSCKIPCLFIFYFSSVKVRMQCPVTLHS